MATIHGLLPATLLLLASGTALAGPHGKADTDGDGAISKAEMAEMRLKMFDRMDADGDGYVTAEEMEAHKTKMMEKRKEAKKKLHAKGNMLEKLDADGDGRVSRDEMANAATPMFDKADADGDGKLTREEMKAMRGKHHERRPESKP